MSAAGCQNDDGTYARGYKLATVRTLDNAGVLSRAASAAIQVHDMALCRPLLEATPVLRAGDLLLEDRGFHRRGNGVDLKRRRQVDVIPLVPPTCWPRRRPFNWPRGGSVGQHPLGLLSTLPSYAVEHMWNECEVPLNACVSFLKKKDRSYCLRTSDLELNVMDRPSLRRAALRSSKTYEQMKSGGWQLQAQLNLGYSEIVFYVPTVVLSYSLYHLFANTQAGVLADKTARLSPSNSPVPTARILSCTLAATLKSLRP